MILSDISVDRPVFATVISLLLITFGVMSFIDLPLRQYPDVNPPVISIRTNYPGASAEVVETKVTQLIEDRVSGIEGIKTISSNSTDGRSSITIEFSINRDLDDAANDIRQRVSTVLNNLPEEADPPEVSKDDENDDPILWLNLRSTTMDNLKLADYAQRYIVDRLSSIDGVARVRTSSSTYAMRIWLDREKMAARNITAGDIENALRTENVELPAGRLESLEREFSVRMSREYTTPEDFARLVIKQDADGHLTRIGDVARVELGAEEYRAEMHSNGDYMIGLGIIKQSKGNTLDVARAVKAERLKINQTLPAGTEIGLSFDGSRFIEEAINEVYKTFAIAMVLVVLVIYLFLGSVRAMLIPAVTVPVSIIASFIFLNIAGFSVNLLTLLALVLSIGLVVDDAILVLENIYRRVENGEPPLVAAYHGAREVGFAVIATTLVLISVFVPIVFIEGETGRMFTEFALAMAAAVAFSSLVALSLSPMLCSKILRKKERDNAFHAGVNAGFKKLEQGYKRTLHWLLKHYWIVLVTMAGVIVLAVSIYRELPAEFMPLEDQGVIYIIAKGPEGSSYETMHKKMFAVEKDLLEYLKTGEAFNVIVRVPGWGSRGMNSGISIFRLVEWDQRDRSAQEIRDELRRKLAKHVDLRIFPSMPTGLRGGSGQPVQFVLQGTDYKELAHWRDIMLNELAGYPGLVGLDSDYKETKPQIMVDINRDRAADLGVSVVTIGRALETMMGSREVTTFVSSGEEYPVILEGRKGDTQTPNDMSNIYVRSDRTGELIPISNLVSLHEVGSASDLKRFNRLRSITLSASLAPGYTLGEVLEHLEETARTHLPATARIDYKGESRDFMEAGRSIYVVFGMAIIVVFLVLAAQFESFRHPFIILLTVPFAMTGAFIGLYLTGQSLNIYSQIGIIMLVGLAAKNGILIVEFANQLRDRGVEFMEALLEASRKRLRPIIMTSITTIMGSVALVLGSGAGAETRFVIGVVVISGVLLATFFTLFIVPVAYMIFARNTASPNAVRRLRQKIEKNLRTQKMGE
ncbi:efflux RND transporter permease subunit [Luteithermobacter gelatinilyticus]|uniref:efflux RND transporter permease subunit n=1 Tax=Luteithermobacter gelatinilyticus TaxID=2582913 RepID=UPI0011057D5A|nr:efflux RND transporter permease subunit [Luteithermobacter gelatinilyticus]